MLLQLVGLNLQEVSLLQELRWLLFQLGENELGLSHVSHAFLHTVAILQKLSLFLEEKR